MTGHVDEGSRDRDFQYAITLQLEGVDGMYCILVESSQ